MSLQISLEHALRTLITGLSAFTALSPLPTVRPYKLAQSDFKAGTGARAVIIEASEEEHQNDLSGTGGGVSASAAVECVAETFEDAWTVAETLRLNATSPGTGLAGYAGTVATLVIQRITIDRTHKGFVFYEDGSDEGYYFVRHELTVDYTEST